MEEVNRWLLAGPPWVEYRARLDLLGEPEGSLGVVEARRAMVAHPRIRDLVREMGGWPGPALKNHRNAGHLLHKLSFLAEIGLNRDDPGMKQVVERILKLRSRQGPFQVKVNINPRYGGTGMDQYVWMLCDAPLVVYSLLKLGSGNERGSSLPGNIWWVWCAGTAGPARRHQNWADSGARAVRTIPAPLPTC